jgi:hypothetical protein
MGDRVIGGLAIAGRPIGQWADLTGAPFVTVSPVGIAKGYPTNNGANYGPDTPGTTTCGIQEAIDAMAGLGYAIVLLPGIFTVHDTITWQPTPASGGLAPVAIMGLTAVNSQGTAHGLGAEIQPASDFTPGDYIISVNASGSSDHVTGVTFRDFDIENLQSFAVKGIQVVNANMASIANIHMTGVDVCFDVTSDSTVKFDYCIFDTPGTTVFSLNCPITHVTNCEVYGNTGSAAVFALGTKAGWIAVSDCQFHGGAASPAFATFETTNTTFAMSNSQVLDGAYTVLFSVAVSNATPAILLADCSLANYDAIFDVGSGTSNSFFYAYLSNCYGTGLTGANLYSTTTPNVGCTLYWNKGRIQFTTLNPPGNSLKSTSFTDVVGVNHLGYSVNTPSVASQANGKPYDVIIRFLTASSASYVITDQTNTSGSSTPILAGGSVLLRPGEYIALTGTLTWEWYGL